MKRMKRFTKAQTDWLLDLKRAVNNSLNEIRSGDPEKAELLLGLALTDIIATINLKGAR